MMQFKKMKSDINVQREPKERSKFYRNSFIVDYTQIQTFLNKQKFTYW
jgi:hypothetical protein